MIRQEDVYKIGFLGKPHGVKGEISFSFQDDIFDRNDAEYLILDIDGILVPFFMQEYRFKNDETALIKFCDIDNANQAQELTGRSVYFPRRTEIADEEEVSWAEIIGYHVVDSITATEVGTITSVDDATINTLFELDNGLLIPASDELIEHIDAAKRQIIMQIPEGLTAL